MTSPMLSGAQVYRLRHLFYMKYKPSEIARELGINTDTIYRSFLPAGAPHERDETGHVWIVGTEFAAWARDYLSARKSKPKLPMEEDNAYCLRCKKVIIMVDKTINGVNNRGVVQYSGRCPECQGKVSRLSKAERDTDHD